MKSLPLLLTLLTATTKTSAQDPSPAPFWPNLHFGLLECNNSLEQYGWPDITHPGPATWNLIGMFPSGDPRPTSHPTLPYLYTMPQNGYPYTRYEGWTSTAFFWADPAQLPDYPRGFLNISIPLSAKGMKSNVQAGTISFEGEVFNCQRENTNLFLGGGTECRASGREFCAGYTYCQIRYLCRRERWAEDKSCVGSQANLCYPSWDRPE